MKSFAVMQDKSLRVVDVADPTITEYQALVKIKACGVCNGTDGKLAHHSFKNFDTYPALLGHEAVGEVIELGEKATTLKLGDLVLLPFVEEKLSGYYSGWGGYSELGVVGDVRAMIKNRVSNIPESYSAQCVLPSGFDPIDATMIVTFREVLSAIRRFRIYEQGDIIIFGAGPVGLCFAKLLRLLTALNIIVIDVTDEKANRAMNFGATAVINSSSTNVEERIAELLPDGADYVVDAVGIPALINQSMRLIKDFGRICCYGISAKLNMNIDWADAPYNWSVDFVQWPSKAEEAQAHTQIMEWIEKGLLIPRDFISDILPFEKIEDAFIAIEEKTTDMKTVITY